MRKCRERVVSIISASARVLRPRPTARQAASRLLTEPSALGRIPNVGIRPAARGCREREATPGNRAAPCSATPPRVALNLLLAQRTPASSRAPAWSNSSPAPACASAKPPHPAALLRQQRHRSQHRFQSHRGLVGSQRRRHPRRQELRPPPRHPLFRSGQTHGVVGASFRQEASTL